jgi:hypothetical protein
MFVSKYATFIKKEFVFERNQWEENRS